MCFNLNEEIPHGTSIGIKDSTGKTVISFKAQNDFKNMILHSFTWCANW